MYFDVSVIVNGALEETAEFYDYLVFEDWLESLKSDAESHGYLTEVYVIEHDHSPAVEDCVCVQYLTDHHPAHVFNA
jgi:hypothetical protein